MIELYAVKENVYHEIHPHHNDDRCAEAAVYRRGGKKQNIDIHSDSEQIPGDNYKGHTGQQRPECDKTLVTYPFFEIEPECKGQQDKKKEIQEQLLKNVYQGGDKKAVDGKAEHIHDKAVYHQKHQADYDQQNDNKSVAHSCYTVYQPDTLVRQTVDLRDPVGYRIKALS